MEAKANLYQSALMMTCMTSAFAVFASRRLAAWQSSRAAPRVPTWIAASLALLAMTKVKNNADWY